MSNTLEKRKPTSKDGRIRRGFAAIPGCQAARVVAKFGGAKRLSDIFNILGYPKDPSSVSRWTYPRDKRGTGGLIPSCAVQWVLQAARFDGIVLLAHDLDPRVTDVPVEMETPDVF